MKKLEVVILSERAQRTINMLQQHFPQIRFETRSRFFIILGGYVSDWSEEDKAGLLALKDAQIIEEFRCKEYEDR